ncbi:Rz-like spanin [Escherichia phage iGC_PHA_EC001]|nr:Rz-like spanin [Escherichia phage iGC_PHA_EC001]
MNLKTKTVLSFVLIVVLILAGMFAYNKIRESGYKDGVAYQTQVYQTAQAKAKQDFDVLQKRADEERALLNTQINNLSKNNAQLKADLEKKKQTINEDTTNYAKTNSGSMSCFAPNDDGLFIINKSFPSSY